MKEGKKKGIKVNIKIGMKNIIKISRIGSRI